MDDLEIFQQKTVIAGRVYSHTSKVFSSEHMNFHLNAPYEFLVVFTMS
jgi:hypothetical protein